MRVGSLAKWGVAVALSVVVQGAAAGRLVIDYMVTSGAQRTAWVNVLNRFAEQNPDIEVVNNEFSQEQYKRDFSKRLESGKVDIAFWFAGERLRDAAQRQLLMPLDGELVEGVLRPSFVTSTLDATRYEGKVYGFPVSYYPWGFFYRKSLFKQLRLDPPETWAEFLQVCDTLKAAGIAPLAVGAKDGWPAAGWFDYLNLRINGIEFHRRLLRGDEKFQDPRVARVMLEWRSLLEKGYFLRDTMAQEWDGVLPYFYRARTGMILMGAFVAAKFPAAIADDVGFFPFPRHGAAMPAYEEAPLDVLVLPARSRNAREKERFLRFLVVSGALEGFNQANRTISPQLGMNTGSVAGSQKMLERAAGITFFFDRDARARIVSPAFDAFRTFLAKPHDVDAALKSIDARSR